VFKTKEGKGKKKEKRRTRRGWLGS